MSNSSPERNKAIVLEAFETLFNKRDYAAAERFWSPNYIHRNRKARRLGRRRHCPVRRRSSYRALGRFAGRGDQGRIRQRHSHVRRHIPQVTAENNAIVLKAFDTLFNRSRRY